MPDPRIIPAGLYQSSLDFLKDPFGIAVAMPKARNRLNTDIVESSVVPSGNAWMVVVEGKGVLYDGGDENVARNCFEDHLPDEEDMDAPCVYLFCEGKLVDHDDPDLEPEGEDEEDGEEGEEDDE